MAFCRACGAENPEGKQFCGDCGAPLAAVAEGNRQRKAVTVVFCDVVGSTALGESRDPEALELLLARYFERMKAVVEAHGGTVEKFIGDAVVAVFGVPVVHEDDALRALRAAVEMREALPQLQVEARLGVNTGEIVTSGHGTLVTGDAMNVAARLQQAAGAGEVLVGSQTLALVRDAVEVEELEPLALKGKAAPVAAFRLLRVGDAPGRSHGARFVGRESELALLRDAWARAVEGKACELVTVVGEPGVGKSRLVAEFVAGFEARVVSGRCLSYGEGITYFPVVEVIKQLGALPQDAAVSGALRSLLGESDSLTTPDEIASAFRKLLEQRAPLMVVFDDIQWGEETFLDLVEQVALLSAGAPLLVVCLARPELVERRSHWPVAQRLEPLPPAEVEALIPAEIPAGLRGRIAHAAGGNPLFVTEMVAMAAAAPDEEVEVPATLKALLAARLDRLETAERGVLERGAVEGELFHLGAVQALDPAEGQVAPRLMALVRKELIRPDRPLLPAEDGFRFCHLLIRDAAYEALPKMTRAELHERFADWLDQHGGDLVERDEIIGYHLQQAHRYRTELGDREDATRALGERAADYLAAAGRRGSNRSDYHAVANLLDRALALGLSDPHDRVRVEIELARALWETGRIAESEALLASTRDAATGLAERGLAEQALVQSLATRLYSDPALGSAEVVPVAQRAIETFEALGDTLGLAEAEDLLGAALEREGRSQESFAARERALVHAQAAGASGLRRRIIDRLAQNLCYGSTPVGEAISRIEDMMSSSGDDRVLAALLARYLAYALAMAGRFSDARAHLQAAAPVLDEADATDLTWGSLGRVASAEELVGNPGRAEQERIAIFLHYRDTRGEASEGRALQFGARLALTCCDQGRWDEAVRYLAYGQEVDHSPPAPGKTYPYLRLAARARVAAHLGRHADAIELARTAVEIVERRDWLDDEARAWLALAEAHQAAGNRAEADTAVARALELYEQKGNIAAAGLLRAAHDIPTST